MIDFKGSQFEREIILWGVRWYVAYPISYRQLEEMMGERGVMLQMSSFPVCSPRLTTWRGGRGWSTFLFNVSTVKAQR
jgi:hypothetical protein